MLKALLIYESLATPSTTVRGLQFAECFEADPQVTATFRGRSSERMNRIMQRWPYRPALRRPMTVLESKISKQREDKIVAAAAKSDVVVMMTVPSISLHRRLADLTQCKLVTDLIDALWLPGFQAQGWQDIDEMLQTSDAVICENQFTAAYTKKWNDRVWVLPDAPQVEVFDRFRSHAESNDSICRIGWIGGKYTADALYQIFEPLEQLFAENAGLELRLVGADPDRIPRFETVRHSVLPTYDQSVMAREVLAMDIGVFPMFDVQESLYRGSLKTRIYMAGQTAVVGQDLGDNQSVIQHGENGMLASGNQAWFESLDKLVRDVAFRESLATAGLATVRETFDRKRTYEQLREILLTVHSSGKPGSHSS